MFKIFRSLSKGTRRSLTVGSILFSLVVGMILNIIDEGEINEYYFLLVLIFGIPITIVLLFAGLWIYSGFKNDK